MKLIIIIIIILLVTVGCSTKPAKGLAAQFKNLDVVDIQSEQILIEEEAPMFSEIYSLIYVGNLLFIHDPEPEYLFKIVNLENGSFKKFGKRGRGPNELIGANYDYSFDNINNQLYIRDQLNLYVYNINQLTLENASPIKTIQMKSDDSFLKTSYCNGGYIVGGMLKKRFGLYNFSKGTYLGKYDYEVGPLVNQALYFNHPTDSKVAFFQTKFTALGILTINGEDFQIEETVWRKSKDKNLIEGKMITTVPDPNPQLGFIDGAVSKKYIYGLYSGKPINRDNVVDASQSRIVYVFDWTGSPVRQYQLDKEARSITIDESDNTLYAVTLEDYEPTLVKFKL